MKHYIGPANPMHAQFDALVLGLPWERLPELSTITRA